MTASKPATAYGQLVRSYDHARLARLPAYQALRQALSDISNEAAESGEPFPLADFLKAVRDMALTAPYGDMCPRCGHKGDSGEFTICWPYAATRDGACIRGGYRCARGHEWTCSYLVDLPAWL